MGITARVRYYSLSFDLVIFDKVLVGRNRHYGAGITIRSREDCNHFAPPLPAIVAGAVRCAEVECQCHWKLIPVGPVSSYGHTMAHDLVLSTCLEHARLALSSIVDYSIEVIEHRLSRSIILPSGQVTVLTLAGCEDQGCRSQQ